MGELESGPRRYLATVCAATIFVSAFLLFQIQPLISKMILPWFGGSPSVWTTCMLFFQVLLLAGYSYAHGLECIRDPRRKTLIYLALLVSACLLLPITRAESMQPADSNNPVLKILAILGLSIGLPYLVVSSTGPLVQAWFAQLYPDRSPYRLYSLSNLGSLLALLSYPILVEPQLTVRMQGYVWSVGFLIFAVLSGWLVIAREKWSKTPIKGHAQSDGESAPRFRVAFLAWFCLPALASIMLLAVTNQLCQNVAVIPLLWIAPLTVYLISFIICFDRERWYRRRWFAITTMLAVLAISKLLLTKQQGGSTWYVEPEWMRWLADNQPTQIGIYLVGLFSVCMLCHGEMVRAKPTPRFLTAFYLVVSAGGAVGGVFVSLLCPITFSSFVELNIGLLACFALSLVVFYNEVQRDWLNQRPLRTAFACVAALGIATVGFAQVGALKSKSPNAQRNFYGVLTIRDDKAEGSSYHSRSMYSGAAMHGAITLHGKQYLSDTNRREPTLYYTRSSGIGVVFENLKSPLGRRVGAVGLGVGTIAAYGVQGDSIDFYEINPLVDRFAREHFTYLSESAANVRVLLGDGRALLEVAEPQQLDILIVDAFSGDTIPTHLLTKEAFSLYLKKHLKPTGVLAIHVSNRHMNLVPVVARLGLEHEVPSVLVKSTSPQGLGATPSTWVLLTRNVEFLSEPGVAQLAQQIPDAAKANELWTDQYNTVFRLLLRGAKYLEEELNNAPRLSELD